MSNHIHTPVVLNGDNGCMVTYLEGNSVKIELWANNVELEYMPDHAKELLKIFEEYIKDHNVYKGG